MREDFVILGGGIAGLAAANRLAELGAQPLLIEGGRYPTHKICGEFFSPGSLQQLEKWNIFPQKIHSAYLRTSQQVLHLPFSSPAGSLSHFELDETLAKRASARGATVLTETRVETISIAKNNSEFHELELSNGLTIEAKHLLIATGRIPSLQQKTMTPHYIGFKSHFSGKPFTRFLEMFSFPGAYIGISPVANDRFNMAGLVKIQEGRVPVLSELIESFKSQNYLFKYFLDEGENQFPAWMQMPVPEFGIKKTPHWLRTYFIGDAAATIPPASGNGLTLAIQCGCLAAHYALKDNAEGFKREWHRRIKTPIVFAKLLHQALLKPYYGNKLIKMNEYLPIAQSLYKLTR